MAEIYTGIISIGIDYESYIRNGLAYGVQVISTMDILIGIKMIYDGIYRRIVSDYWVKVFGYIEIM